MLLSYCALSMPFASAAFNPFFSVDFAALVPAALVFSSFALCFFNFPSIRSLVHRLREVDLAMISQTCTWAYQVARTISLVSGDR